MNYFEIINATLIEMNYSTVAAFADLTKSEHKRLMNVINRLNKEICSKNNNFYFRQMIKKTNIYADKIEYSINISGKIDKILGENEAYSFEGDYTKFYCDNPPKNSYGIYGEKILFPAVNDNIKIFYVTENFVKNKNGELKADFEFETDESIIPANFAGKLFINGAAYNFKQNTAHPKYLHWKRAYDMALADIMSTAKNTTSSNVVIDGGYRKL